MRLLSILALMTACSGDKDDTDGDHTHHSDTDTDTDSDADADADSDTDTDADVAVELAFLAMVGGEAFECGGVYTTQAGTVTVNDFRFYVSNVALVAADGTETPLVLDEDGIWQGSGVALLDFEDATAGCAVGTPVENHMVSGTAPAGTWDGVAFDLGVPFELNHQDVALASPPLNVTGMFWSWQGGYKFLRVDMVTEAPLPWHIHLGSTMCMSNGPSEAPSVECDHPNRPRITLRGFDPLTSDIVLDLDALLAGADTSIDTPSSPPGCMSNPTDVDECPAVFTNLGIDFATGVCTNNCDDQGAFSAE